MNDLFMYVSHFQDLCMKALQSLFLLHGLAPSFLTVCGFAAHKLAIARSTIPKKKTSYSLTTKLLLRKVSNHYILKAKAPTAKPFADINYFVLLKSPSMF